MVALHHKNSFSTLTQTPTYYHVIPYIEQISVNDQAPLAVGGYSPNTNKAESLDIASNTWTEVDNYPYHDWYVFHIFQLEV